MRAPRTFYFLLGLILSVGIATSAFSAKVLEKSFSGVPWKFEATGRTVLIGDTHADPDATLAILTKLELIDSNGQWIGGDTQVVFMGDNISRGPNSRFLLDFIYRLGDQARAAGGEVHRLLGNHEYLAARGQVADGPERDAYSSFGPTDGDPATAKLQGAQRAFANFDSEYAADFRARNSIIQIGDIVAFHAGLPLRLLGKGPVEVGIVNDVIRRDMAALQAESAQELQYGPLPFKRDAKLSETAYETLQAREWGEGQVPQMIVDRTLDGLGAKIGAVAHISTSTNRVQWIMNNRIVRTDSNISSGMRGHDPDLLSVIEFRDSKPIEHNDIARPQGAHPLRTRLEGEYRARWNATPHHSITGLSPGQIACEAGAAELN